MNYTEAVQAFRMLGFNFSDGTGVISSEKKIFGRIENNTLIGFGGTNVPLDSIKNAVINQITGQLLIVTNDDSSQEFHGKFKRLENSLSELIDILPFIASDINDCLYYDEMTGRDIVNTKLWGDSTPTIKKAEDADISKFRYLIETGCEKYGFKCSFSRETRMDAWIICCDKRKRNLWVEWLESLKWDGKPRLRRWFIDCLGACAPSLRNPKDEAYYIEEVTQAWFMGAVARAYKETKHEIVPVVIGKQGDGKSEFIRYTAYSEDWYRESISKFEDEKTFREKTEGAKIIELAESKQLRSANVEELKMFISKSSDVYREAYGRKSREFRRHWILVATSNDSKIFIDKTGNRRFFPFFCNMSKISRNYYDDVNRDEVKQVWAEALVLYNNGAKCRFERDSEIARLSEIVQSNSTYDDDVWTAIDAYLDDPCHSYCKKGSMISKSEIYDIILDVDSRKPPKEVRYSVNSWVENNKSWENCSVKWYNGKTTKNVLVRKTDAVLYDLSDDEVTKMYKQYLEEKGIKSCDPAKLDTFMRDANIDMSIIKISTVLMDNNLIFERQGTFYIL